ncbi:MAG TPA: hypothetical protein VMW56_21105 [Candidatus Margulisiibacteriota bacterium]|nr:hypothetical protein [Candidatus Margulisiibacteriota bacterium]
MRLRKVRSPGPPTGGPAARAYGLACLALVGWAPIAAAAEVTGTAQVIWTSGIVLTSSLVAAAARPRR